MGGASHSGPGMMDPRPPKADTERFRGESLGGQFGEVKEPRLILASAGCTRDFMLFNKTIQDYVKSIEFVKGNKLLELLHPLSLCSTGMFAPGNN
jgi:hypothetical protein